MQLHSDWLKNHLHTVHGYMILGPPRSVNIILPTRAGSRPMARDQPLLFPP